MRYFVKLSARANVLALVEVDARDDQHAALLAESAAMTNGEVLWIFHSIDPDTVQVVNTSSV